MASKKEKVEDINKPLNQTFEGRLPRKSLHTTASEPYIESSINLPANELESEVNTTGT